MRPRTLLLGAGLYVAAATVIRRARRHGDAGDTAGVRSGWATCSAPSARWYEVAADALLGGLYRRMADDLAAVVAAIQAPEVLEVGPGPGALAVELARRVPDLRLSGLDVDPAMVELARARALREGLADRLEFVVGDVAALPFPDASFDLVTSSFSAHHWPDGAAGFGEIRRVLRPGGRAIVYDLPDRWGHFETKALGLAEAATAGGFDDAFVSPFRWPGRLGLVRRLGVARPSRGE
jgi:SAM-dependent methyltransferase